MIPGPPRAPLRLGIAGMGVGGADALPAIEAMAEIDLRAAAITNARMREIFRERYPAVRIHEGVDALSSDPDVDAVLIATPNPLHAAHTLAVIEGGKHVLVYRPMAFSVAEAAAIVTAARRRNVHVVVGRSLGYTMPFFAMRRIVDSGRLGRVRAINVRSYTEWMLTSRSSHDRDPDHGGVLWKSGPDFVDVLRVVHGGKLRSVRAMVGRWMPERPMPGYYSAYLEFEDGTPCTLLYNGHGYFVGSDLTDDPTTAEARLVERIELRRGLREGTREEDGEERSRRLGGPEEARERIRRGDSGPAFPTDRDPTRVIVSCDRGDLLLADGGLRIYDDAGRHDVRLDRQAAGPGTYVRELSEVVLGGKERYHDAVWDLSTIEVCAAIARSAAERRDIELTSQAAIPSDLVSGLDIAYPVQAGVLQ